LSEEEGGGGSIKKVGVLTKKQKRGEKDWKKKRRREKNTKVHTDWGKRRISRKYLLGGEGGAVEERHDEEGLGRKKKNRNGGRGQGKVQISKPWLK